MPDLTAIFRDKSPSWETKGTLACGHLLIVLAVVWLLCGDGIAWIDDLWDGPPQRASVVRRGVLVAAAVLYFLRTLATLFVFMRRRMPWSEVVTIVVWIGIIDLLIAYFGGRNEASFGALGIFGAALLILGSVLNTGSEWQRHRWKQQSEHAGHLYTQGLFRYSRHVNYFGDEVLFTGWVLLTGRAWLLVIPVVMVGGFVFVNIPAQDKYLEERYGDEYRAYASRVRRFIPFVY